MGRSGRSGTGSARYRRNRAILLAADTRCWLCGHGGAATADHVVGDPDWPRLPDGRRVPGFDDLTNLAPAHGTMGAGRDRVHNPCPVCRQLCNQVRGARRYRRPQSRRWFPAGTEPLARVR
jgi:hypothetical protein